MFTRSRHSTLDTPHASCRIRPPLLCSSPSPAPSLTRPHPPISSNFLHPPSSSIIHHPSPSITMIPQISSIRTNPLPFSATPLLHHSTTPSLPTNTSCYYSIAPYKHLLLLYLPTYPSNQHHTLLSLSLSFECRMLHADRHTALCCKPAAQYGTRAADMTAAPTDCSGV
ncbi:hypothetical protein EX30DRAFT_40186 [Ascodesmis nigricans]|uniref:Uncharacterized protein n=1 Tax=Ascodesmis nigricans TaxID=341454 RepID=A0A4S2MWC1_9PEZI|nr:hypothetical protein EX30DRAFT_40186 [Ascodesmis nigricans]